MPKLVQLIRFLGCVAAAVCATLPAAAESERPLARVEYRRGSGTNGCISERQLERSVERRLRRRAFDESRAELFVTISVERHEKTWFAKLTLSDSRGFLGQRELSSEARHCSALDDSLALVLALLVDTPPERPAPEPEKPSAENAHEPPSAALDVPSPSRIELPPETLAPREPWRFEARAAVAFAIGLLPSAAPGGELAVAARPPRGPWLRLSADDFLSSRATLRQVGAEISAQRFGAEVCGGALELGTLRFDGCFGQRVGRFHVSGFGFQHNLEPSAFYYSLAAALESSTELAGAFGMFAALGVEAPLTRARFTGTAATGESVVLFGLPVAIGAIKVGFRVEL